MSKRKSLSELKAKRKAARRAARMALFGTIAVSPARNEVLQKFLRLQAEFGANDPAEFLFFLKEMRRGYDFAHDGPSPAMAFVDSWRKVAGS